MIVLVQVPPVVVAKQVQIQKSHPFFSNMLGALTLALLLSSTQAINVYLSPYSPFLRSALSPADASAELSRHLGLEAFEPFRDSSREEFTEEPFVGRGQSNALLLTIDEEDVQGVYSVSGLAESLNSHSMQRYCLHQFCRPLTLLLRLPLLYSPCHP
jgi:hypothetical protein